MLVTAKLPESVPSSHEIENIRYADSISFSSCACTQFVASMLNTHGKRKGPVCRNKLVLIYLCSLLLAESYAPEPNPGPRPCKYPCGYCSKAVKWTTPGICCDTCDIWYHQECLGMKDCVYLGLTNVSWECIRCGMPNFSSALFDTLLFETSNQFDPLSNDISAITDTSFGLPQATSSPKTTTANHTGPGIQHVSTNSTSQDTLSSTATEFLTHPSFNGHSEPVAVQRSLRQGDDIPLKVLIVNCHSVVDKKPMLENMIEATHADIVLGTESWLKSHHLSTEIFPTGFKVYRKDREHKNGGGVFILVSEKLTSTEPEGLKVDGKCELVWAQIQVPGSSQLFVGSYFCAPDVNDPEYLGPLQICLGRIPVGAHTWIGGDFNLGDIDWETESIKPYASKSGLCKQLLTVAKDNFLEQMVSEPTRITEDTENVLDLSFSNNSSLVNRVEVIPGISDHETVYVESSLRPAKAQTPPRKVHIYNKADFPSIKAELRRKKEEFASMEPISSIQELWNKFRSMVSDLMTTYIPTKTLSGKKK